MGRDSNYIEITSISELHQLGKYPGPKHPLISVIEDHALFFRNFPKDGKTYSSPFYVISCKQVVGSFKYGRGNYDFTSGTLLFTAPGQLMTSDADFIVEEGWMLLIHPDMLHGSNLGRQIHNYTFFNYEVNEALHLSEDEHLLIKSSIANIKMECQAGVDKLTQSILVSSIELILHYCERFYQRQFLTRSKVNTDIVMRFERLLKAYFGDDKEILSGLPDVGYFADKLNISSNYLSDLLQKYTKKSTIEHIHMHLIDKAKSLLMEENLSISQIAYGIGFEHASQFTRLFKKRTGLTPTQYRHLDLN